MKNSYPKIELGIIWATLMIIPHFQGINYPASFIIGTLLTIRVYFVVTKIPPARNPLCLSATYLAIVASIILTVSLAFLEFPFPYLLFSRLGSYTMFLHGKIAIFGDLLHLTSAAGCPTTSSVGLVACDPWNRPFNQNPDLPRIMSGLSLTNAKVLGIFFILMLSFTLYLLLRVYASNGLIIWLMYLTPPMVLAIDRGNETFTLALILSSILIWKRKSESPLFLLPLLLAAFFKIWPFALFFFLLLTFKYLNIGRKLLYSLLPAMYLLIHYQDLILISESTQKGSTLGGSFGISLLFENGFYSIPVLVCSLLLAASLISQVPKNLLKELCTDATGPWVKGLMLTYVLLYLSGPHFNYRLIVLIPLCAMLWGTPTSRPIVWFIFALLLTSRLNTVLITSTALSLIMIYLFIENYIRGLPKRSGP